jgi:hypothetical protein
LPHQPQPHQHQHQHQHPHQHFQSAQLVRCPVLVSLGGERIEHSGLVRVGTPHTNSS